MTTKVNVVNFGPFPVQVSYLVGEDEQKVHKEVVYGGGISKDILYVYPGQKITVEECIEALK